MVTQYWGFQFLLILDLLGIGFHAVVVFGMGKDLWFKSVLGHCVVITNLKKNILQVKNV